MKVTGNVKYIPAGTTQYIVDGNDGQINVDTSISAVTIVLPNIINSGYANTDKGFIINDISNNAATNNITIVASNNTTNSQSSVLISVNGGTAKCSIASLNEWFVITEPTTSGMSGNLTANYIPKAVTSSTLGNSVIYQNGSNIGINTTNPLTKLTVSANDQSSLISSVRYETVGSSPAGIVSLRARGTDLLPTALLTDDEIANFAAVGYYGAGFGTTGDANFIFYAAENFTLTNRGTSCKVGTTPLGTSSVIYNFGINSEGNVSIGIPSLNPTARVHIKGDATASNFALKVDNFASSPLLYVNNAGNIGIGIAPTLADVKLEIKVATNQRFLFINSTYPSIGAALTLQAINDATTDVVNVVTLGLDWYHASRNNLFSNDTNTIIPTAKVHIIGNNQGSDLYALKVDNLGLNPLLYVRNDGMVGIGTIPSNIQLEVVSSDNSPYGFSIRNNTFSSNAANGYKFYQENDGRIISYNNSQLLFAYGASGNIMFSNSQNMISSDTKVVIQAISDGSSNYSLYARGNSINSGLSVDGNGNVGINQLTAGAKLHIKGNNQGSDLYALKVDNLGLNPLFYVRNDGLLSAPSMPTSNAGLTTGDMYVDTAANILANGDKVVGWKV